MTSKAWPWRLPLPFHHMLHSPPQSASSSRSPLSDPWTAQHVLASRALHPLLLDIPSARNILPQLLLCCLAPAGSLVRLKGNLLSTPSFHPHPHHRHHDSLSQSCHNSLLLGAFPELWLFCLSVPLGFAWVESGARTWCSVLFTTAITCSIQPNTGKITERVSDWEKWDARCYYSCNTRRYTLSMYVVGKRRSKCNEQNHEKGQSKSEASKKSPGEGTSSRVLRVNKGICLYSMSSGDSF